MTRVGLALGGGGARGAAHFGVLKVFEEERIPIDLIAGTSMGAIVGAMYAQNPDASAVIEKYEHFIANMDYGSFGLKYIAADADQDSHLLQKFARTIAQRIYMSSMGHRSGIMKPEFLDKALKELLDRGNVQDTKIPFGAVATDLNSGNTILIREGSIRKAVRRSSLIPGYLPPEEEGAKLITDGGGERARPGGFRVEDGRRRGDSRFGGPRQTARPRGPQHDKHNAPLRPHQGYPHVKGPGRKGRRLPVPRHERQRLERIPLFRRVHKGRRGRGQEKAAPGAGSAAQEKALVPAHLF